LQYKDLAADGGLYPVLRKRGKPAAPQPPVGCKTGAVHPQGLGTGRSGHGAGLGDMTVGLNWWGERREPQSSARELDLPTAEMGESKETPTSKKGGEHPGVSAPFNKQTAVLRAVASARTPLPLQKCCKIADSLLIFSIFC